MVLCQKDAISPKAVRKPGYEQLTRTQKAVNRKIAQVKREQSEDMAVVAGKKRGCFKEQKSAGSKLKKRPCATYIVACLK